MKKLYIPLLMLLGFFTAHAQAPVSFVVQADADDWQLYMSSRVMQDFNTNNKMVFITLTAGDEGKGTATLNGSAIPYYKAREKGSVNSAKFACDISVNGQTCTIESTPLQQSVLIKGHTLVKYVYKNTVSYFLRLPDGGASGDGYTATGFKSLEKLEAGDITSLSSIDGANTYTGWDDLTETIRAIVTAEKNTSNVVWLHTGSLDETANPNDNSDHVHAAMAADEATSFLSWVGNIEYVNDSAATLAANIPVSKFEEAAGLFGVADYALVENKYSSKLTAANIALFANDYYTVTNTPSPCDQTSNLTATSITYNSAILRWKKIPGAVGYQVDYRLTGDWISAGSAIADSFVTVNNLTGSTTYQWRVRTKCLANGNGSDFMQSQFTTAVAPACMPPVGLTTTNITTSSAKLNWSAVVGATSYTVEGKMTSSSSWVLVTTTTATNYTVYNLAPSTSYQWRIKTKCSNNTSSATYSQAQFSTLTPCTDIMEYNNSFYYAKSIATGVNYNAQIAYYYDNDYYKFTNTSAAKNIRVTLTNLPADYDIKVYNELGFLVGSSQNWGTTAETIVINTTSSWAVGTYRVSVYGYGGAYNSSNCYNLKVDISASAFTQQVTTGTNMRGAIEKPEGAADDGNVINEAATGSNNNGADKTQTDRVNSIADVNVYPMPVFEEATISFEGGSTGKGLIVIHDAAGRQVKNEQINVLQGHNTVKIKMLNLAAGFYTINIKYGTSSIVKRIVVSR